MSWRGFKKWNDVILCIFRTTFKVVVMKIGFNQNYDDSWTGLGKGWILLKYNWYLVDRIKGPGSWLTQKYLQLFVFCKAGCSKCLKLLFFVHKQLVYAFIKLIFISVHEIQRAYLFLEQLLLIKITRRILKYDYTSMVGTSFMNNTR